MAFTPLASALLSLLLLGSLAAGQASFQQQGGPVTVTGSEFLGEVLSISADGTTAAVSTYYSGTEVYVFVYDGTAWTKQAKLTPGTFQLTGFGTSVSLSANGARLAVGAPYSSSGKGAVYLFRRDATGTWVQSQKLLPPADALVTESGAKLNFGMSVALSPDINSNSLAVGGPGDGKDGATWVFDRSGAKYVVAGPKLVGVNNAGPTVANGRPFQGSSVRLSNGGLTLATRGVVGPSTTAGTYIFVRTQKGAAFTQQGPLLWSPELGYNPYVGPETLALSRDGKTLAVVDYNSNFVPGAAIYVRANGKWKKQRVLTGTGAVGSPERRAVSLTGDGNTLAIGGPRDGKPAGYGAVWLFTRSSGIWSQLGAKLVTTPLYKDAQLGAAVALSADGSTLAAGADYYSTNSNAAPQGAVYFFKRSAA